MNKVKVLLAMLVSVIAFGVTSYASEFRFDEVITHDGEKAVVNVYVDKESDLLGFGQDSAIILKVGSGLSYSDDWTNTELYSSPYAGTEFYDEDGIVWYVGKDITEWNADTDLLFTAVLTVEDPNGDLTVAFDEANSYAFDNDGDEYTFEPQTVTITAETPVDPDPEPEPDPEPQPGDLGEKDGYVTVVDDAGDTRFVLTDTKTSVSATAATVLKATYAGTTKQANLANLLGATIEDGAEITIGKITIKMVLPASVTNSADIADYSFEIK